LKLVIYKMNDNILLIVFINVKTNSKIYAIIAGSANYGSI